MKMWRHERHNQNNPTGNVFNFDVMNKMNNNNAES